MLNPWKLTLIVLAYMGLLFAIAWFGDKQRIGRDHRKFKAVIYSLSLGVYCTSWTFYGAVGSAASTGWGFLPIYLGPVLMMLFGFDIIRRIALTSRDQRITSIADFIAYRYGRSHTIAVLVTCAAVIGVVPYIALQLRGITAGIDVISRAADNAYVVPEQLPLYLALSLAVFAMMFGTRNMDASEHHRGLMWAIAFESLVKLLAFIAIGLFAIFGVFDGLGSVAETMRENTALPAIVHAVEAARRIWHPAGTEHGRHPVPATSVPCCDCRVQGYDRSACRALDLPCVPACVYRAGHTDRSGRSDTVFRATG